MIAVSTQKKKKNDIIKHLLVKRFSRQKQTIKEVINIYTLSTLIIFFESEIYKYKRVKVELKGR